MIFSILLQNEKYLKTIIVFIINLNINWAFATTPFFSIQIEIWLPLFDKVFQTVHFYQYKVFFVLNCEFARQF